MAVLIASLHVLCVRATHAQVKDLLFAVDTMGCARWFTRLLRRATVNDAHLGKVQNKQSIGILEHGPLLWLTNSR